MAGLKWKNTTGADIEIRASGQNVPANGEREISPKLYASLSEGVLGDDLDLIADINSGDIVLASDDVDLSAEVALRLLETLNFNVTLLEGTPVATSNKRINYRGLVNVIDNGDGSIDVVFGQNDADDLSRQIYNVDFSGDDDQWLRVGSEDNNSDETPYVFPFNVKLVAIGYSNKKAGSKFELELWKSLANSGQSYTKVLQWDRTTSTRTATIRTGLQTNVANLTDVTFAIGDKLKVYLDKDGGEGSDNCDVRLYFEITSSPLTDSYENFSTGSDDDDDD